MHHRMLPTCVPVHSQNQKSALWIAAREGHKAVVQYLMERHNFVLTEEYTVRINCCMCESIGCQVLITKHVLNNMQINSVLGFMS